MKYLTTVVLICIFIPILFLVLFTPKPCNHENTMMLFSFQPEKSTAYSNYRPYCKDCDTKLAYTNFKGAPNDQSYLEIVKEYCGSSEIVAGEYYTLTAIVSYPEYDSYGTPKISCKIENDEVFVGFSVEFREEFREFVSYESLEEGTQITFRGRLYDNGFGFSDAELIIN